MTITIKLHHAIRGGLAAIGPFILALLLAAPLAADEKQPGEKKPEEKPKLDAGLLGALKLRSIGPALMSGRISDIAIDRAQPNTWYVAAGSGNVWKTTNAGTTWTPIFENYGSFSIGCIAIDPSNHHTIWIGTGENVAGRHVGYGDGVYRSLDGGKSFKNMGLKASEHIARILIDPGDSRTVFVAAQGPLWAGGGERGLYKSSDGGETWVQVLARGPYTGATDAVFDPRSPGVLYAAMHQRHRAVWSHIDGGPESGIFKSMDGGKTWRELKNGLPAGDKGKIAIDVSPLDPDVVYASIELPERTGGFWRSANGGEAWEKMSDFISGGTGPHYYQEIWCDPRRFDVVYQADVRLARSEDGGRTWKPVESPWKHVDNHALAFHPQDPDFLLAGCDGGLYRSFDRGETFDFFANLPVTQFYKVSTDNDEPFYNLVGGTQDNATQYGPSRTLDVSGIRNDHWRVVIGGDGHDCAIDPEDPNIIYGESQNGFLRRYDRRTGESVDIQPQPGKGEDGLRFNWDSPILISPHSHTRLYFGSRKLQRSDDRGDSWTEISPDLSRGLDRLQLEVMERVWSIDAIYDFFAMSEYGNITSISESPLAEGLIYAGTDDGLIQVTEDGGGSWRKVEKIYGVPELAFVNDVKADLHDADAVYAAFDHHKAGDFKPYLLRSTDRGRTWTSIAGDLPDRHLVWRFVQDHIKKDLYFAGTEFGIFATLDGGAHWIPLKGGVPTISFRDLEIQKRESDLVGASFGRGFFILDDYSPLRLLSEESLRDNELILFPVKKALLYVPTRTLGGEKGSQGDAFHTAPNPPSGAVFTYYLRDAIKTRKQARREKEEAIQKSGGDTPLPSREARREEAREEEPAIIITITDAEGRPVNRIPGPTAAGLHRLSWNLRYPSFTGRARPGASADGSGPLVLPGTYTAAAAKRIDGAVTPLGSPQTFEVAAIGEPTIPVPDRGDTLRFLAQAGELSRAAIGASEKVEEVLGQVREAQAAIRRSQKAEAGLIEEARALEIKLLDARERLVGDPIPQKLRENPPPSVLDRIRNALGEVFGSTYGPTATHRRDHEMAREEYGALIARLRELIETEVPRFYRKIEERGLPWTPGRPLPELKAAAF